MFHEQKNNFSDRLILKNYVLDLEIGAYNSERNCTQKVKFDVVLDVDRGVGIESDDLNDILSYEIIVEAIKKVTSGERINLLEKCAELIANICLQEKEVKRAHVKIEKLERIEGQLGIEIVREKKIPLINESLKKNDKENLFLKKMSIVYISNSSLKKKNIFSWFDKFHYSKNNYLFCIDPYDSKIIKKCNKLVNRKILELSYQQNAMFLMDLRDYFFTFKNFESLNFINNKNKIGIYIPDLKHINKNFLESTNLSSSQISLSFFKENSFKKIFSLGNFNSKSFTQVEIINLEEIDKFV